MAAVATQVANGYAVRLPTISDRSRHVRRVTSSTSNEVPPLQQNRNDELPRAASYTHLPEAKEQSYTNPNIVTIKGSFSEADLIASADDLRDISPPDSSGWTTPDDHEPKLPAEVAADLIAELQKSPKITIQHLEEPAEDDRSSVTRVRRDTTTSTESFQSTSTVAETPRSRVPPNTSFSRRMNRRSWYSTPSTPDSRSPSPPRKHTDAAPTPLPIGGVSRRKSCIKRKDTVKPTKEKKAKKENILVASEQPAERNVARRSTTLRQKVARPVSGIFKGSSTDEAISQLTTPRPPVPALPKSWSTDRLPNLRSRSPLSDRTAPMPTLVSNERTYTSAGITLARKKDELWSVFRSLDTDYAKFASKSVAFKANVVRTTLLPFLRMYATHPSNQNLRPEALDRRCDILNKWWVGLIEMLHGRNNASISGTDRPAILDAISGIMERSEWRLTPSPFCPLDKRRLGYSTPKNRSTTSLSSNASEFLAESVYHNVRNIFVQNLSSQMAFVVDKMSLRNASASLVTFCGKACAYAFMFVTGMADVLVRLWDLQIDSLRRVLDENGIGKFDNINDVSEDIISAFPPAVRQLGFASLMKYMRRLRTPPPLPLGTSYIQWWGYWLERWTGRDSDLFYVFVKQYHILVTDFLPPGTTKREKMAVPGLLLVHAQILTNLDATIHRDAGQAPQDSAAASPSPTFDDVLADPDAVATTMPAPPSNAVRLMAENRLIMLIRDFLSERTADHPIARHMFAESFNDILQTAARGTSIYDHAACYTLLDFLEEALIILVRYENIKTSESTLINSDFWQLVCKKMISSQNTLTEIRLFAFLYTVWNTVVCDLGRKADICIGLLLDPEIFESSFNHWCPMVRAYFMRLLCWRVGRFDGEAAQGDVKILETMLDRLRSTWSYYLWLRDDAASHGTLFPPTNPCHPAPSRRLLIIRTDTQVAPNNSFLSFDGVVPAKTRTAPQPASKRFSTLSLVVEMDTRPDTTHSISDSEIEPLRGIRGFLTKMMGSRTRSKSQGPAQRPKTSQFVTPEPQLEIRPGLTRSATEDLQAPRERSPGMSHALQPSAPQHRNFSFKFSLEYHPNSKAPGPMRLFPPRLPMPAQMFLQSQSFKANPANVRAVEPTGESRARARYCGRALAEWQIICGETQSFFERRKKEGVPGNKFVETPTLGVEVFKRPS